MNLENLVSLARISGIDTSDINALKQFEHGLTIYVLNNYLESRQKWLNNKLESMTKENKIPAPQALKAFEIEHNAMKFAIENANNNFNNNSKE